MNNLQIFLFGKFCVQYGDKVLTGLEGGRIQELFCYLLLYRNRCHPRETLANLLWNETPTIQSKSRLRKPLWQIQSALDSQGGSPVLLVDPDWVQINPEAGIWLDVTMFEQACTCTQGVPGESLDTQSVQTLRTMVDLYRGDLLEGCYSDWCLYERERLQHMYLNLLDKLMAYSEAHQEFEAGVDYGERILRFDRARERTHRRLMRLQYLARDRTAALRQYDRCVTALNQELGVEPAVQTVALYNQIRADLLGGVPLMPAELVQPTSVLLPKVLVHLQQLQLVLTNVQCQVQKDIQLVEAFLKTEH